MSLILRYALSLKITLIVYHHRWGRNTKIPNKLRCKLAVLQSKHVITNKEFPSNALLFLSVTADYFNYLPWSLLSKNSTLTTASGISCCVHIRYLTILFQDLLFFFSKSITPLWRIFLKEHFMVCLVLLESWQEKQEVKPESSGVAESPSTLTSNIMMAAPH